MRTGSVINHIYGDSKAPTPVVGMGVTILGYTDRHPATVVEVSRDKKRIVIQADHYQRTDKNGMSECQDYTFSPNTGAHKVTYTLRKNGAWVQLGGGIRNGQRILLGRREKYHDFSF